MALRPLQTACQTASRPWPTDAVKPIPVITTRSEIRFEGCTRVLCRRKSTMKRVKLERMETVDVSASRSRRWLFASAFELPEGGELYLNVA